MHEIFSISKKLWQLLLQVITLTMGLSRQAVLPNRKRKGNLLNTLFLFFIGLIENIRQFEHRNFKMADLLQNKLVRKGLMLVTFLLFFLTSFEQPAFFSASRHEPAKVECSCQSSSHQSSHRHSIRYSFVPVRLFPASQFLRFSISSAPPFSCSRRYLQTRRLLI